MTIDDNITDEKDGAMFSYSLLGKTLEKNVKTIEDQGEKKEKPLKSREKNN